MTFRRVLDVDELWPGELKGIVVEGVRVLLANIDGTVHAFEDRCLHQGVALSKGKLEGVKLTCPAHEWEYDVCTGQGLNPCGIRLRRFPTLIVDDAGEIHVDIDESTKDDDESTWVGPVFQASGAARKVVEALLEQNPRARVVDRGAYLRVLAPSPCRLSRNVAERHSGASFVLPTDLEVVLSSFKGKMSMTEDDVTWTKETSV